MQTNAEAKNSSFIDTAFNFPFFPDAVKQCGARHLLKIIC